MVVVSPSFCCKKTGQWDLQGMTANGIAVCGEVCDGDCSKIEGKICPDLCCNAEDDPNLGKMVVVSPSFCCKKTGQWDLQGMTANGIAVCGEVCDGDCSRIEGKICPGVCDSYKYSEI